MSAPAQALLMAAEQAVGRLDMAQGLELAERAVALGRSAEHRQALGWALMVLARIRAGTGDHHRLVSAYANALEAYELLGERGDIERQLMALNVCAMIRWEAGDSHEAIQWLEQGICAARQHGLQTPWVKMLRNMAVLLSNGDEHLEAIRCCEEAIAVLQERPQQDGQIGVFLAQKARSGSSWPNEWRRKAFRSLRSTGCARRRPWRCPRCPHWMTASPTFSSTVSSCIPCRRC